MKRSLFIVYSNLGLGGMPVRITDIVNALGRTHKNTDIYILLKEPRNFDLRKTITNRRVRILDFYRLCPWDSGALFMVWVWYQIFLHHPSTILAFISPYALTILITRLLFFWRRTRLVINEGHYTSTMVNTMAFPTIQRLGIRLLYPLADSIIVPTKAIQNDLVQAFAISKRKTIIVPNWSRYALYPLPHNARPFDLIYTGRLEKTKNVLPLLQLCRSIISSSKPKLRLLVVGEGSLRKDCVEFVHKFNLNHNIFIKDPIINVSSWVKRAKIFVCNSDATVEGFPVSMLDALSLGTLVISRQFKGIEDVLDTTNGHIVHTDSEMAETIVRALRKYSSEQSKIRRGKHIVRTHHSIHNIWEYIDTFML